MLPEMRYIEQELLPMLRELAPRQKAKAERQLAWHRGEPGICPMFLSLPDEDIPAMRYLPDYDNEEIHYDPEKMFVSQLKGALHTALAEGDAVPSVRANVGCGCINTLLGGVKQTFFADKMPWLLQHIDADILNALTPDDITDSPEFSAGLAQMRFMRSLLEGTGIGVYPMDIQGPVDMAHLWLGDEFFYLVYDDPETVHHALQLSVACIDYAFSKNLEIIQPKNYVCHYNSLVLPREACMKISEDTSPLLCDAHLREYMLPYTKELFSRWGGYIHYCGDNRFLLPIAEEMPGSLGLNFGNPERHGLCGILNTLKASGKRYISLGGLPFADDDLVGAACRNDGWFALCFGHTCRASEQSRLLGEHAARVELAWRSR